MKQLNEMTIGRTGDPENPFEVSAFEAVGLFGAGSRNPSGPAVMMPRQQAGHMIAIDPPVRTLSFALESREPSTQDFKGPRPLTGFQGAAPFGGFQGEALTILAAPPTPRSTPSWNRRQFSQLRVHHEVAEIHQHGVGDPILPITHRHL